MIKYVKSGITFSLAKPQKGGGSELNIISNFVKYGSIFNRNLPKYLQKNPAQNSQLLLMVS